MDAALPVAPLIAEAKRRARQRRVVLVTLVSLAIVATLSFALWPSGGAGPTGLGDQSARSGANAIVTVVPANGYERQWRRWIARQPPDTRIAPRSLLLLRERIERAGRASGARVIRLRLWRTSSPAGVELVVATGVAPATYLRHKLARLLTSIGRGYHFVEVVDRDGSSIFQAATRTEQGHPEGMVGVPRPLQACSPVADWGPIPPPCPVS